MALLTNSKDIIDTFENDLTKQLRKKLIKKKSHRVWASFWKERNTMRLIITNNVVWTYDSDKLILDGFFHRKNFESVIWPNGQFTKKQLMRFIHEQNKLFLYSTFQKFLSESKEKLNLYQKNKEYDYYMTLKNFIDNLKPKFVKELNRYAAIN